MVIFLLTGCDYIARERKGSELVEKCKTLTVGMKKSEVISIMGRPNNVNKYEDMNAEKERLTFTSPALASELTSCLIDVKNNTVEEITCAH